MGEWIIKPLGSMCVKIGSGATPTGGQENYKYEGISLIRSQNVEDFVFSYNGLAHIDDEQAEKLNNVIVEANDTLINITGDSVARVCSAPVDIVPARVNQHVAIIRTDNIQLDSRFAKYSLLAMKEYLLSISEIGATRRALTKGMLENLDISAPNIEEQRTIVEVLSSFDDKIDLLTRQNTTLETLAQTYFRQWFVENNENESINVSLIATLENININPARQPLEQFYHYSIPAFDNNQIPIFELGKSILSNKFIVQPNSILVSKLNPATPRIWRIDKNVIQNSVCSTEFQVLKPQDMKYYLFLYCLMKSNDVTTSFTMSATGTSGSHQRIRPEYILEIETPKPDIDKLSLFNEICIPMMEKVKTNAKQILTLQKLRDTLLPKLISGEVRIKQLGDNVNG
jgi:type I restriction enzyme S subunit